MMRDRFHLQFWVGILLLSGCTFSVRKPCTDGGQPPREGVFQGSKRCYQEKDSTGAVVNHGKYFDWYPSEKIRTVGEYKMGKKTGRWTEYDESGKKISDAYFEDGKEVSRP